MASTRVSPASVLDEPKYTIAEAARRVGPRTSAATIFRWAQRGVGGVKLRITRIGGRSYVLHKDLEAFISRRSDPPSEAERRDHVADRAAAAGRQLDKLGLGEAA